MQSALDRRERIKEHLILHPEETVDNLAFEFGVSRSTIKRDLAVLAHNLPLYTTKGTYGGVHLVTTYNPNRIYLKADQEALLRSLNEGLSPEQQAVMQSILDTFSMPRHLS